jgi:hypothetical protein
MDLTCGKYVHRELCTEMKYIDDQPELDALCFPIFAHTFLDLVYHNFISAGELGDLRLFFPLSGRRSTYVISMQKARFQGLCDGDDPWCLAVKG